MTFQYRSALALSFWVLLLLIRMASAAEFTPPRVRCTSRRMAAPQTP